MGVGEECMSNIMLTEKEKKEKEDKEFLEFQEIDALRFANIKEYVICTPPPPNNNDNDHHHHNLHLVGAIQSFTQLKPFPYLGISHAFIDFNNGRKARLFEHMNIDGTPTFAGYVFGDMKKFTNFLTAGGTEEYLRKLLDTEVARNPMNFASKV